MKELLAEVARSEAGALLVYIVLGHFFVRGLMSGALKG